MIVYFTDRDLSILAHASTSLPAGYRIREDTTTEEVETGVNTFTCTVSYDSDSRTALEDAVQVGRYVLKQSDTTDSSNVYDSLYQILEVETDTKSQEIRCYAEDAGLDLLNTLCPAVKLNGNISYMMRYFLPSDWTLNLEDTPTNTRTYTWDGESTATERLMSVANLFGCELYYSFDIDRLQVTRKILNVTKKRGNQTAIPQLRLNFDVDRIYCKQSIADLVTAINVTGGTPENQEVPINLKNYTYSYTDPTTGDVYKVDKPTGQMRNITAMQRWSSVIDRDGLWVGSFTFDTTDKAVLAGQARAELQKRSQIAVNYEVDFAVLPDDVKIGDRVNIIDEHGELYLDARLLRIESSVTEEKRVAVIGEYLIRQSGISEKVAQMASDLASARENDRALAEQLQIVTDTVGSLFTLEVDSDIVLGTAHLTARLLNGKTDVKTDYDPNWFKWILRNENGESLLGRGYTLDVNMDIIGYASTVLCRFIRPELYDLTDHNNVTITDANLDPIQVSYAGIYNQPVATRNLLKSSLKALRATQEVGNPTVTREVNLYEKDSMRKFTQHFWTEETGEHAGAHITEVERDEFLADPTNGGGNLLARSTGIAIRDGMEDLAVFGADGARVGKPEERHIDITPTSFNVVDEDNSVPFSVSTDGSLHTNRRGMVGSAGGIDSTYSEYRTQIYLQGYLADNKVYFGVGTSRPTSYNAYIENPTTTLKTITVDGVLCSVKKTATSTLSIICQNTNTTKRYIGVEWIDKYHETFVKVNDSILDAGYHNLTIVDSEGTSLGEGYSRVYTYGKLAQIYLCVYNTNSKNIGELIYRGELLNYLPVDDVTLLCRYGTNQVVAGRLFNNGGIAINNTGRSAISSTSASYMVFTATYIYQ